MQKLPKYVLFIIFILLYALMIFVISLVRTILGAEIKLTEVQYYIIMGIVSLISFMAGIVFIWPQKSWTIENLILKINNVLIINTIILNLQQKKTELIMRDPVLKEIPDCIQVVITKHTIGKEK